MTASPRHRRDACATGANRRDACATRGLCADVLPHVGRNDLADRMGRFYADLDRAIASLRPVCRNRGDCCKFDRFGHKLYATTLELAYFIAGNHHHQPAQPPPNPQSAIRNPQSACPYQVAGQCVARPRRPLGCRIFFCDPGDRAWQGPEYERRLTELKQIGTELGVPYRYTEWLSALAALNPGPSVLIQRDSNRIDATGGDMID